MGGPFWARKTAGAWSVPKGGIEEGEDPLAAALREFQEETGLAAPPPPYRSVGSVTQRSGKTVYCFVVESDLPIGGFTPGTCVIRWRGRDLEIPELDRIAWTGVDEARSLLVAAQSTFLDRLDPIRHRASPRPGS